MSHYSMTPAQSEYLRRQYAREAREQRSCDCPGCERCTGFTTGCRCDEMTLREVLDIRDRMVAKEANREGQEDVG